MRFDLAIMTCQRSNSTSWMLRLTRWNDLLRTATLRTGDDFRKKEQPAFFDRLLIEDYVNEHIDVNRDWESR